MPAGVVFAVAVYGDLAGALLILLHFGKAFLEFRLIADDADEVLHLFLKLVLDLKCITLIGSGVRALERLQRCSRGLLNLIFIYFSLAVILRELRREPAGPFAEDQKIGQRISAKPVGAVQTRRRFAGGEEARNGGHLRLAIDPDAAHHVVRGGPYLHRFRRVVDIGKLLELVIHARQLLLDMLRSVRDLFLDPRNIEKNPAVRASAAGLDLAHDAARDV